MQQGSVSRVFFVLHSPTVSSVMLKHLTFFFSFITTSYLSYWFHAWSCLIVQPMLAWVSLDHKLKVQVLKYYLELKNCLDIVMVITYESCFGMIRDNCCWLHLFYLRHSWESSPVFYWMLSYFWHFHLNSSVVWGVDQNLYKKINIEYKLPSIYMHKVCLQKPFSQEQHFVPAKNLFY